LLASPLLHSDCYESFQEIIPQTSDTLHFGRLWKQIKHLEESNQLEGMIEKRRQELLQQKEHWRGKIEPFSQNSFHKELKKTLATGELSPSDLGCGGAYILYDESGAPCFVVKPIDEDILCLNNRKFFASPYHNKAFRVRADIPLYRSAQTEALAYRFAQLLHSTHLSPETALAIISSPSFHDIGDRLAPEEKAAFYAKVGAADRERLCSIQRFLSYEESLYDVIQSWVGEDLTEEQAGEKLDSRDFEDLMLFIWSIYDTDGHVGNFPAIKGEDTIYHLKKIDNGLAFPNQNSNLFNVLYFLPHARQPLSERLKKSIEQLPLDEMIEAILFFEMAECKEAFIERMDVLQSLSRRADMTFCELDMRLRALQLPGGKEIALGEKTLKELEVLLFHRPKK